MKRFLKRCVFKFRLKISRLFDFRISKGNLFHKKGAHILKAHHPYVLFVKFVSFLCNKNRSGLVDRRPVLPGTYKSIKRLKYIGAWLFKILYTNINNLKTILSLIGNQWRSYNIGVISSLFFFTLIKRAAEFWIAWSFLISFSGLPYKILMQ